MADHIFEDDMCIHCGASCDDPSENCPKREV